MDSVTESIYIRANKARVFDAFVNHINEWWLRKGKFSYSFAPEKTQPKHVHFEPRLGGRYYEIFENGEEYQIGQITIWEPPNRLAYTWKGEEYKAPTTVEVIFSEANGQTLVTLTHSGFEAAGVPDYAESYGIGWDEILGKFDSWLAKEAN